MAEAPAVNSSPIIALAATGHIHILRLAAPEIVVTRSVVAEIRDKRSLEILQTTDWLRKVPDTAMPDSIRSLDLGAGEKSVLAWAAAYPGTDVILDDKAARRCALGLGLRVRGTLGLVLLAKKKRVIPVARPLLEQLRTEGLFLSDKLMNQTLALVGE